MEPVFYIMAILGCGEADAACQQVAVAPQRYESSAACNEATPAALTQHSDIAFPVVVAQCRRADDTVSGALTPDDINLPAPEPSRRPAPIRRTSMPQRS